MNKNGPKIIIVVVCLVGAGLAIMWNLGMIGGGGTPTTGVSQTTAGANDSTQANTKNDKDAPTELPAGFHKSKY